MLTAGALSVRAKVVQLFRRGTQDEQTSALDAYDNDARALTEWSRAVGSDPEVAPELARAERQLAQEWVHRLSEYVAAHPDARPDLEALVGAAAPNSVSQHNSGWGTFVNGAVSGGVHNSYGGGSR
ncbi:hypothetical protein [Streptomyces sp. DSM 40907]|uniref:hypothetical protein n=1 Tax=Streptomyces kutzneri TaxID=3051179 RepID=UPI0028D0A020|nr:hypothetical protein [Streptomyces sp. DSM 40907]